MVEKEQLKTQLLQNIRSCLFHLLPRGIFRGDKFYVGDVQGNKGKSTVIELTGERAGLWKDFATGEGGDIIDLWAAVHGKNAKTEFPEVTLSISEWLGIKEKKNIRDLEQHLTCSWNYYDENNQLIVIVYRYDPPLEKKQFKPFDVKKQRFKEPEIRPLYNIPGILKSDKVILVEGEKCAEALIEKGITATTAMFGANAPIDKTDWTPLRGKHVIIWPDNDEAGNKYAKNAEKKLLELGVASLATLRIPPDKLRSWDAADAVQENIDIFDFIEKNSRKIIIKSPLDIFSWSVERFVGPVPKQRFLVEGLFPLGVTSILAAMGDTGKGMLLLDLALKVAASIDQVCGFGPPVTEHGSVVVFSAEDDTNEIHRRLEPVHNLLRSKAVKARTTICRLVLSFRSQFFHNLLHFSNQAKERSTTHLLGNTTKECNSFLFTTSTVAPIIVFILVAKFSPV